MELLLGLLVFHSICFCTQGFRTSIGNPCVSKNTCGECITANPECSWCSQENLSGSESRCDYTDGLRRRCSEEYIVGPEQGLAILKDQELNKNDSITEGETLHIKPQEIILKLRPNSHFFLRIDVRQPKDYLLYENELSVQLRDNASRYIDITYYSKCLGNSKEKTNICRGIEFGTNVTFEANIKVNSCPKDSRKWNETFQIYCVGLLGASIIHLQMICECDCEKPWNKELASDKCSAGGGSHECGICNCYDQKYGKTCECDASDVFKSMDDASCYMGNKICSGRGQCVCGKCDCFQRWDTQEVISGQFCECDNFTCERFNGKVCGGLDHGTCVCGVCMCRSEWQGPDCSCAVRTDTCLDGNSVICSGHGVCECGHCKCFDLNGKRYSGRYCERCLNCPINCDALRDCVECQVFPDDSNMSHENCTHCMFISIITEELEVDADREMQCIFRDEKDCEFTFKYVLDEWEFPIVYARRTKDCPKSGSNMLSALGERVRQIANMLRN